MGGQSQGGGGGGGASVQPTQTFGQAEHEELPVTAGRDAKHAVKGLNKKATAEGSSRGGQRSAKTGLQGVRRTAQEAEM